MFIACNFSTAVQSVMGLPGRSNHLDAIADNKLFFVPFAILAVVDADV